METRILLVDDHAMVRQRLHQMLEQHDEWKVCGEAANGKEALDKLKNVQPDLVVMDFMMPQMNGLEASQQIIQRSPETPILMLTVYATGQLMNQAKSAGVKGFCSKNKIDCIVEAVSRILQGGTYFHTETREEQAQADQEDSQERN